MSGSKAQSAGDSCHWRSQIRAADWFVGAAGEGRAVDRAWGGPGGAAVDKVVSLLYVSWQPPLLHAATLSNAKRYTVIHAMAIPDFQSIMLPILRLAEDGQMHRLSDVVEKLATDYGLSDMERRELLSSGRQTRFHSRVGWARTYLKQAGLLSAPKRSHFQITDLGKQVLSENLESIDMKFLEKFPEYIEFRKRRREKPEPLGNFTTVSQSDDLNPEETFENAYQGLHSGLIAEVLETVKECSPVFFEHLVVDLIVRMGYGGSRKEAGQAIGKSGDEGIDGIIKEDRLGLEIIYIQAKRWEAVIGRPEIQKFAGALQGQRARKGIFITTSSFSRDAHEYTKNIEAKIILIDGNALAEYMVDNNVGVTVESVYEIKRIDSNYFSED